MQAIDENGFVQFLCPPTADDDSCLINRETLRKFLRNPVFVHVTPPTGHVYGHAKKVLTKRLQGWLQQPLEGGGTWGRRLRWNEWDGQHNHKKRGRGSPEHPPEPCRIYRSCGIQEQQGMCLLHMLTPFRRPNWTPEFWTPYRQMAATYGFRNSDVTWVAAVPRLHARRGTIPEINDREPFWLLATRGCRTELLQLIDIFKEFVYSIVFVKRRHGKVVERTTEDNIHAWSKSMPYRVGWDGDVVACILCILRMATDPQTVPNVVVFDGEWDLAKDQQHPSTSPEVIVLHPRGIKSVTRLDD